MWSEQKIQAKKDYFAAQRKQPTGNFTEYVVRTYYYIYKSCSIHKSNFCPARDVSNYRLKNTVYDGISKKPDHDYSSVIDECKSHLLNMGYIHTEQRDGEKMIFIDKPLDFLMPEEHEIYLKKYSISYQEPIKSQPSFDIHIHPVKSQNELTALLHHMADPVHHPDPYTSQHTHADRTSPTSPSFPCEKCDGHYVVRNGKNGTFFGCSNYPRCTSSKTIASETYAWLEKQGLRIYEVERPCWKCQKPIKLRSYFPQVDLLLGYPQLASQLDLSIIRLGTIDTLDQYLAAKHKEIYMKFSKQFGAMYMANNCPHCRNLQGTTMSLESMYKYLIDTIANKTTADYVIETIVITEASLSKKEWNAVITEVLKYHK